MVKKRKKTVKKKKPKWGKVGAPGSALRRKHMKKIRKKR